MKPAQLSSPNSFALIRGLARFVGLFQFPEENLASAKIQWVVRLRWVAVGLFFLLSLPAYLSGLLSRETFPMFLGIVGLLLMLNLASHLTLVENAFIKSPLWLCFQMAADLAVLTALLALSGGFRNPFLLLLLLHAALGAVLIPAKYSWSFLALVHLALGSLQLQFIFQNGVDEGRLASFAIYHFLILVFWLVLRSLGNYLESQHDRHLKTKLFFEKQDRLRAVGALAAGFSHEFASPLNAAKLRLERLEKSQPNEDVQEALSAIRTCEQVVQEMNSSQLDARSFQFRQLSVGELLRDVVDSWREVHPKQSVQLQIEKEILASLPPVNFAQVILNLLDNASEAAPDSPITVRLFEKENSVELNVVDQGPGFPESELQRIGEPFFTTKPHGTGLGLYVSQLFAESLGGQLLVENASGGGANITLRWPVNRVHA